mgnify:CR=1 FL=1
MLDVSHTNITLRLKSIKDKLLVLLFFSTGLFNNSAGNNHINFGFFKIKNDTNLLKNDTSINQSDTTINQSIFESEIEKDAHDSIRLDVINRKAFLYGNAQIKYQKTKITANYIEIDWNSNEIFAKSSIDSNGLHIGKPVFSEGNDSFKAEEITYNFKSRKCKIKNIITKEGEGYIHGKIVKKMNDDIFYIKKGDYTTCDAEKPHFSIKSNKIKVIPGKKIITGPAYLSFFNFPTPIFIPFGFFPNHKDKSSGILIPSYGESVNLGFFLKDGGYYFGLDEKTDLSIKSDIYSKGSWNIRSQFRYNNRYKYNGNVNLNYGNIVSSIKGFPDYSVQKDFNFKWMHKQDAKANPSLQFSANLELGSSTYHRNNSYNAEDYLKNTMSSSINLRKKIDHTFFNNINLNLRHSQNTSTRNISLTIPDISVNSNRIYPLRKIGDQNKNKWYDNIMVKYSMNTKNTISTPDSLLFNKSALNKFRNGMQHKIPINTSIQLFKYFSFKPSINLTERWYISQIEKKWNSNNNSIETDTVYKFTRAHEYSFSSSLNTKLYGMLKFKKSNIAALRHVITPNISFNYRPDFSEKKYGYYKEVQSDTIGNTQKYSIMSNGIFGSPSSSRSGNIGFGVSNILEIKTRNKNDSLKEFNKIKILESLNIRSSYNMFADSLNLSDISLNARTRILDFFEITFSSKYDPYTTNREQNKNINVFELKRNNRLARLKSLNTTIGLSLNDQSFSSSEEEKIERDFFEIPWDINANYSLTYNKGFKSSQFSDTIQSLNFSGNVKISNKWKLGFRSGYDFDEKKLTYTTVDIYRDLHCWEMLFNWIPIGYHQSYTITIRVKAEILKDLKYERKRDFFKPEYN